MTFDNAAFPVHRDAREIAHVLVGTGELVEKGRLPAVLVTRQGKGQFPFDRLYVVVGRKFMKFPRFPKTRMVHRYDQRSFLPFLLPFSHIGDFDFLRVLHPKCQFIALDHELHRISQGRKLNKCHFRPGNKAHIQEMLAKFPFPTYDGQRCRLPLGQFI